jgi:tetratricopeptide (TPR) repeat protein
VRGLYYAKVGESILGTGSWDNIPQRDLDAVEVAFHKAIRDLETSLTLTHKPLLTYSYEMIVSTTRGDIKESRRLLDQALKVNPNDYVVRARYCNRNSLGGIKLWWGRFSMNAGSRTYLIASFACWSLSLQKTSGWNHFYVDRDYAAAEAAYRRSAALGGDRMLPILIDAMMRQSKYREVIEPLTDELSERPGYPLALDNRGEAYMKTGRPREAIADWTASAAAGSAYAQNQMGIYPIYDRSSWCSESGHQRRRQLLPAICGPGQ